MKIRVKKSAVIVFALFALTAAVLLAVTVLQAEAKTPRNGRYVDAQGHIYIMSHGKPRTGYFRYHGNWYYGHKTSTAKYPKGSVTTGEMRIKSPGMWYAYGSDGKRINKDRYVSKGRTRKVLQLDIRSRNSTVRYVYGTSRGTIGTRYSTRSMRMQEMRENGKWRTVEGMQFVPEYVDTQR